MKEKNTNAHKESYVPASIKPFITINNRRCTENLKNFL